MEAEGNYGYRHILKYTSIFGSVQGLNIVAALIRNKFAALFLGPAGIGLASLLTVTMNFLSQTAGMGLSLSATRYFSAYYDKGNQQRIDHLVKVIRVWCLLASLLGILLSLIAGYWTIAPAVAVTIIGGGEMSILKGARRLRSLAVIQTIAAIASVVISVPLYWKFGQDAIVAVINLMAFATMLPAIYASYRLFTPRFSFTHQVMGEGVSMLRLGVSFTLAAMVGSGTELFIRSWLEREAGLSEVGLYNAGYLLTVTYVGLVFAAMENDYFPRLSATHDVQQTKSPNGDTLAVVGSFVVSDDPGTTLDYPPPAQCRFPSHCHDGADSISGYGAEGCHSARSLSYVGSWAFSGLSGFGNNLFPGFRPACNVVLSSVGIGRNGYCHSDSPLARPRDDSYVCTSSFRLSLSRAYLIYNRSRTGDGQHGSVYQYVFPC